MNDGIQNGRTGHDLDFAEEVKDALLHLFDFAYLQNHPLARTATATASGPELSGGQWLRREIVSAIEALAPENTVSFRAPQARPYQLLQLRYVEGMTVQETARELGVSERQAYRDLKRGEDSVAAMLSTWWHEKAAPLRGQAIQLTSIESEMAGVEVKRTTTELGAMMRQAIRSVERLAASRGITLDLDVATDELFISTDPSLGVQVLTNVLSHVIQQTSDMTVRMRVKPGDAYVTVQIHFTAEPDQIDRLQDEQVVAKLIARLGWSIIYQTSTVHDQVIDLKIPLHGPIVLIVDDNRGLVELLDRYLTGHACKVVAAGNGAEGLKLAVQLLPQAIILDVMMPDMDGWEVLQRIRTNPDTADIPVVICSVFDDPELAYSLGASLVIPKPTRRVAVLEALRELGIA